MPGGKCPSVKWLPVVPSLVAMYRECSWFTITLTETFVQVLLPSIEMSILPGIEREELALVISSVGATFDPVWLWVKVVGRDGCVTLKLDNRWV